MRKLFVPSLEIAAYSALYLALVALGFAIAALGVALVDLLGSK